MTETCSTTQDLILLALAWLELEWIALRRDFPIGRNRRFPAIAALAKDERRERGREAGAAVRRRRGKEVRRGGAGSGGQKNETKGRGSYWGRRSRGKEEEESKKNEKENLSL
ncbi:hypothetical protein JCGZ_01398 [Jatropha curcas]|uniref:Uncharacterized protein n=1 Tax=Jatropha curcas TaxID=180498 RepID=A0A067LCC9_JATCU|nr:hypothetical protein JCGZ_01398 [Jatropha curcas]